LNLGYCMALKTLPDLSHLLPKLKVGVYAGQDSENNAVRSWFRNGCIDTETGAGCPSDATEISMERYPGAIVPKWVFSRINLTSLNLSGCRTLKPLPDSIGQLSNLALLNLGYCRALVTLPDSIGQLTNLETLDLQFCEALTHLPNAFRQLTNLANFDLKGCVALTYLPDSFGQLANLANFGFGGCMALKVLPDMSHLFDQFTNGRNPNAMASTAICSNEAKAWIQSRCNAYDMDKGVQFPIDATELRLSGEPHHEYEWYRGAHLPDWVCTRTKLVSLDLTCCFMLASLPESLGQLTNLEKLNLGAGYRNPMKLTSLPESLGQLTNLKELNLRHCEALTSLPASLGKLANLALLDVNHCHKLASLPDLSHLLPALQVVTGSRGQSSREVEAWIKNGCKA